MPRGEPTRVISIRLPEELVVDLEAKAGRVGTSVGELCRSVMLGTFHHPGSPYTWAEAKEREKLLRFKRESAAKIDQLSRVMQSRDPDAWNAITTLWAGANTTEAQKRSAQAILEERRIP